MVFDINFYDKYDNLLEVENRNIADFKAKFKYGEKSMTFQASQIPGKIHMFLSQKDNEIFKFLPPRANYYEIEIIIPTSDECAITRTRNLKVVLTSTDKMAPI